MGASTGSGAPRNKVIVAIANKLARIAWAVLSSGEVYRHQPLSRRQAGRGKDAALGKHKTLSTFPPPRRRCDKLTKVCGGENGRENSQTTCRKTWLLSWFPVTERFIRTGTCGSSSVPGEASPLRGRIHLRRLTLRPTSTLAVRRRTIHLV